MGEKPGGPLVHCFVEKAGRRLGLRCPGPHCVEMTPASFPAERKRIFWWLANEQGAHYGELCLPQILMLRS